jgi:hypothetical protein
MLCFFLLLRLGSAISGGDGVVQRGQDLCKRGKWMMMMMMTLSLTCSEGRPMWFPGEIERHPTRRYCRSKSSKTSEKQILERGSGWFTCAGGRWLRCIDHIKNHRFIR